MDTRSLSKLDSFPYRHRCADVMRSPAVTVDPEATVAEAVRIMVDNGVSSLVSVDDQGRATGIITERDILRAMAQHGPEAGNHKVAEYLSSPVAFVRANAFLYMALGRMARLNVRHLAVIDGHDRVVGVLTTRSLVKLRSAESLQLGDRIAAAENAADLDAVRRQLPDLAANLFAEDVEAVQISAVISAVYCDMTRRACQLAVNTMEREAWGAAPAPWAMLVLGSGGRGESLLAPDQDNAIVHRGTAEDDPWFAEVGRRVSDILDAAGLPYCKGGVMASNRAWRKSFDEWRQQIDHWVHHPTPESLLMVDIFYDFIRVYGDQGLANDLRTLATEEARTSILFLQLMAAQMEELHPPLTLFGRFRTENGRIDLKRGGLLPLVRGARVMALEHGVEDPSTRTRLEAVAERGVITPRDHARLRDAQETLAHVILEQQIVDIRADKVPSARVNPKRFTPDVVGRVKEAVRACESLKVLVKDSLGKVGVGGT